MMALFIAASGGIAVGLAVGGLFGWFSHDGVKVHSRKHHRDNTDLPPYHTHRK